MKKLVLIVGVLLIPLSIFANSVTVELENDILYKTDQRYTHGTKITYEYNDLFWSIGQNIYTPTDITSETAITNDRPYSGTLYMSLKGTKQWEDRDIFHQLELTIGVAGGPSLAEETQILMHEAFDAREPMGWEYQVDDMLLLQGSLKVFGEVLTTKYLNLRVFVGGDLGTVITRGGFGGNIIAGYNIPHNLHKPIISKRSNFSLYAFGEAFEQHVFFNKLLESDYTDITTVDSVLNIRAGVGISYKGVDLRYAYVIRTREFVEQVDSSKYGSIYVKFDI